MAGKKIGIVLAADGEKEFRQAMANARKETQLYESAITKLSAEYEGNANSLEYLQKKQAALEKQTKAYEKQIKNASDGLKNAENVQKRAADRYEELKKEVDSAREALKKMEEAGQNGTKEYKDQEKAVENYEKALQRQGDELGKCEGKVIDWQTKLTKAQGDLEKTNRALQKNESYLKEAEAATDQCATSIDEYGNAVEGATEVTTSFGEKLQQAFLNKGVSAGVDLLKQGADALKESLFDASSASSQLAASTGLSEAAAQRYQKVMQQIKGDNFGEDYGDVADAMSQVIQIMGELDDGTMKDVTEGAITLRDTFGMDVNESIRAVDVMMKTMGVDAKQAFNLIVTGAQNGLNRSGELVDNITEYGQLWGQAGFSAEEMFSILENGLNSGAYNLDKVNDYVKEFGVSLADGRIEDNLSSFSTGTQNLFMQWKNGEASTKDVFYSVISDLEKMQNQQEALTIASEVWSALGEDNAMQVLTALNDLNDGYTDVKGAMESLKEVKYSDLESSISGLGDAVQEKFVAPLLDVAIPGITDAIQGITDIIDPPKTAMQEFTDEIGTANEELSKTAESAAKTMENAEVEGSRLDALGAQLISLNGIEEKSAAQKMQMKAAVDALSESVPQVTAAYDEEAGKISLTDGEIRKLISSKKELLVLEAAQQASQEVLNSLVEAEVKLRQAEDQKSVLDDRLSLYQEEKDLLIEINNLKNSGKMDQETYETTMLEFWQGALDDGRISLEEFEEATANLDLSKIDKALGAVGGKIGDTGKEAKDLGKEIDTLTQTYNEANAEAEAYTDYVEDATDALFGEGEAANAAGEGILAQHEAHQKAQQSIEEAQQGNLKLGKSYQVVGQAAQEGANAVSAASEESADASERAADAQEEAAERIKSAFEDAKSEIQSSLQDKISLFDLFEDSDGGEDITVEEMQKNLDSQIEAFEEYQKNLEAVKDHVGKEIAPEFMQYLEGMGMDGANALKHILATFEDGEPEKVKELSDSYLQAMDMTEGIAEVGAANQVAYEAAMGELGSTDLEFDALRESIEQAQTSASEGWSGLSDSIRTELETAVAAAQECGVMIPEGLAEGIASGEVSPEAAIASLEGGIRGQLEGLAQIAQECGIQVPAELAAAIESGDTSAMVAAYDGLLGIVKEKSGELSAQAAEGMKTSQGSVEEAATATAQAGADAMAQNTDGYTQAGEQIGDSIIQGIRNKGTEIQTAIADVLSAGEGTNENSAYMAIGESVGDAIAKGVGNKKQDIQNAVSAAMSAEGVEGGDGFRSAGEQVAAMIAAGITGGGQNIMTAASAAMQQGAVAALNARTQYLNAGTEAARQFASGITGGAGGASTAAANLASRALSAVNSNQGSFRSAGSNMSAGVASGISSGASGAIAAARSMAASALAAAKAELDIHSPSRKFQKDVGEQISAGMAFGIKNKASLAGKQAKTMSNKVYKEATSWLSKYKKSHEVSLADEKYYWQQVVKHTKKGTTAYNNAVKKLNTVKIQEASGLSSSVSSKIAGNFGVSKTTGSGKNKKTKSTADYYSEIYSAAKKYIDQQQILNEWSLQQQLAYWQQVQSRLKKGTDAWYDATAQVKSLQQEQAQAAAEAKEAAEKAKEEAEQAAKERLATHAQVQDEILSKYKTYYKVSAKAEADYWNLARQQFKAGTDERIEADQKYFDALQEWYDQRKELDEDYAEDAKDINDQLIEDIQDLQDAYKDAVASRKEDILSQMSLFEAWDSSGYDADTLLYNLKTQVAGLALWEQQLEELEKKGLATGLLEELKEMGPEAAANIYSLNQMTAAQLAEYNKLWEQKEALAESQAVKDNETLRQETNSQIGQLRNEAQSELAALNAEYQAAIQELNTGISADLRNLVNKAGSIGKEAVSGMIGAIGKAANSVETYNSTAKVVNTVSSQLSALAQEGSVIGKSTLDGILAGMMDYTKIEDTSKEVIQSIKRAMEEEAQIHSPSRLFRRETGPQIPAGVAEGIQDGTKTAVKSSRIMVQEMLEATQAEMKRQQDALQAQAAGLNYSGITKLNRALESYQMPKTVVNVDNSLLATLLGTLIGAVNGLSEKMDSQTMILDTGELVAALQPQMDKASGEAIIIKNRGRYG